MSKLRLPAKTTSGIAMSVVRTAGQIMLSYDARQVRGADFSFAADCARAVLRHGMPELHFGQLDLYDETKITRLVVVRYGHERFAERAAHNEVFRQDIEAKFQRGVEPGHFVALIESARPAAGTPAVHFDAELDAMFWSSDRSGIIFLVASGAALHAAAVGSVQSVNVVPALEVTLSTAALLDLLTQWKALSEEMRQ